MIHRTATLFNPMNQVGDDSGTVRCFEIKKSETHECFSFCFGDSDGDGRNVSGACNAYGTGACGAAKVTALAMGGVTGGAGGGDRAFTTQVSCVLTDAANKRRVLPS